MEIIAVFHLKLKATLAWPRVVTMNYDCRAMANGTFVNAYLDFLRAKDCFEFVQSLRLVVNMMEEWNQ
jgi:hypothetical protein